ncbi:MAG: Na+/H+ antiporter NhaC family protein, partial [Clostridium sp.]|nr:Na+/H+ antiporter NhaC family protein [Clostridium sp.]
MDKKGTKIAYFVACAVFVVLLVVLGISFKGAPLPEFVIDGETVQAETPFAGTFWSLLPPIVAIVLALISKEVYSSLFLGCLVGALLYTQFNPWHTIVELVGANYGIISVLADAGNMGIIVFLVVLGIMVDLMNKGGGSEAFGRWAKKTVKSRCAAQLLTMLLGVLIFIDDYFNCLTVGAVMRPVTESHKISRAKLAYIIDATAAPVCMIAPVSSWAAAISGYVTTSTSIMNLDYGLMLKHEYNAQVKDDLFTTPERPFEGADDYEKPASGKSSVLDLLIPVVVLIIVCIIALVFSGGYFTPGEEAYQDFVVAFSNAEAGPALALGGMIALVFTFIYFWVRAAMANAGSLKLFLPAVIFIIGAAIGFATGTSWGTIGIMAPIVVAVFDYSAEPVLCTIGLAAACSGGVMGDHCSPISDTT